MSGFFLLFANVCYVICQFLVLSILSKNFIPNELGEYFLALAIIAPVMIFFTLKFNAYIRTAADYGHGVIYKTKKVLFNMLTNAFSTKVIGVCYAARTLTNTPLNKWETVYNGIDTSTVLDSPKHTLKREHKRIIMLGRIDPVKNHKFIINVFSSFSKDDNITLDIFGEGESAYVDSLKALIASSYDVVYKSLLSSNDLNINTLKVIAN